MLNIIESDAKHQWYWDTIDRAEIMSMFYKGMEVEDVDTVTLSSILPQSTSESDDDYDHRLERTPIIPFEKKFVRAKERIFQGHGVSREPETTNSEDFYNDLFDHFDDQGEHIDKFFRDKVFKYKEVYGFGGIVIDLLTATRTNEDGEEELFTYTDENAEPIPYAYLVRPKEIFDFRFNQGYLQYVIIRQDKSHEANDTDYEYRAITPDRIFVWREFIHDIDGEGNKDSEFTLVMDEAHEFDEVPFLPIKGEDDMESGFQIGKPERYSLVPMYRTAIEIYYDLQEVSLLYGHPVPVMGEQTVKELIGAVEDDGKYNPETISAELGAVVQIPDNADFPDKLFYQPDTQGLKHLKDYLFDIIESIHKFASIRDKSQIVANTSGVSKALDTVEERGVLAKASRMMEELEHETLRIMTQARSDVEFESDMIEYPKEFDLSTADQHFQTLIEGMAGGALTFEMYKYHAVEGMRKSGAPKEKVTQVKNDLDEFGLPLKATVSDLLDMVRNADENTKQLIEGIEKEYRILENFEDRMEDSDEDFSDADDGSPPEDGQFEDGNTAQQGASGGDSNN